MQFSFHSNNGATTQRSFPVSPSIILYFMAVVVVAIAVALDFFAGSISREAELLAAEGMDAEATVTDSRIVETRKEKRDSNGFTRTETDIDYYLTLEFLTAEGRLVVLEKSVSNQLYNKHDKGDKLTIRYAKSDPTVTEFEKGGRAAEANVLKWVSWGLGAFGLVLGGVGFVLRRKPAA